MRTIARITLLILIAAGISYAAFQVYDDFEDGVIDVALWATGQQGDGAGVMEVTEAGGALTLHATCSTTDKNNQVFVSSQTNFYDLGDCKIRLHASLTQNQGSNRDKLYLFFSSNATPYYRTSTTPTDILVRMYENDGFTDNEMIIEIDKALATATLIDRGDTTAVDISPLGNQWYLSFHAHARQGYTSQGGLPPGDITFSLTSVELDTAVSSQLLYDDFSDGDFTTNPAWSGVIWTTSQGGITLRVDDGPQSYGVVLDKALLVQAGSSTEAHALTGNPDWRDVVIEADAIPYDNSYRNLYVAGLTVRADSLDPYCERGVCFRITDNQEGGQDYAELFAFWEGHSLGSSASVSRQLDPSTISRGTTYRLRLQAVDTTYIGTVYDEFGSMIVEPLSLAFGHSVFNSGRVGVGMQGGSESAYYDNISVYRPVTLSVPDTVASYAGTVTVPVTVTNASGSSIVASELSVAYDSRIVTSVATEIAGSLVALGWSIEENILPGVTGIDTLAIAMSTAQDTIATDGNLIYLNLQTADIRHPDSTALQIVHALFNDGTPSAVTIDGSLKLVGSDGIITATPDSIIPREPIAISVTDIDADIDVGTPDQVSATVYSALYGDTQTLSLVESGNSTGIFNGNVATQFALAAGPSNDGVITTIAGDSILATVVDSLSATGTTVTRTDKVKVIGGVDGQILASYVVQALDQSSPHPVIRDTVRVQITDTDLDLDVGLAEQVSATITNAASGEVETVTLAETDVNTGIFQIRVPTIAGSSGISNDGVLSLVSWSELEISYTDSLTARGSIDPVLDTTQVVNLFGDADPNDDVRALDAARLLAISVGLVSANTQTTLVGDVDGSGDILAIDASFVLQYVVRLIDRFPVQIDADITLPNDPKNHPFLKPVPLDQVIALGNPQSQTDGTYLLPITLSEREGILSGTLSLGVDPDIEVLGVTSAPEYGKFMTAFNTTDEGVEVAFAGSKSNITGSGDVLFLKLRAADGIPIRLSLDQVYLNGQSLTPTVNIEAIEAVETQATPLVTQLYQNVPNPFNPQTTIRYDIAEAGQVSIVIYGVIGQRIRTLVSDYQDTGSYQLTWDGLDAVGHQVSSGIYLVRMRSNGFVQTQKMLLLR